MSDFRPPVPPIAARRPLLLRLLLRLLMGTQPSYIANFIDKSYEMKMGHIWLPGRDIFMPNMPDLVRRILVDEAEHYPKSDMLTNMLKLLLGNGVFVANGPEWKRQRRLIDPAFALAKLQRVFPMMSEAARAMHERFAALPEGEPVSIDGEMTHVTADVIFRTMFSVPLEQRSTKLLFEAFMEFQNTAFVVGFLESTSIPNIFALGRKRRARKSALKIRRLIEPFVEDRCGKHERGESLEQEDILSYLVAGVDPETGTSFTFDELVDQTCFLILAGHETSASALSWALYLIAMQPDVQTRMYEEVLDVLDDREPQFSDIRKLVYIRNVFRETLRLYPPVGFLPREATRCEMMRDKNIKPRDVILISPWLLHRHRLLWQRPDVFDPSRFDGPQDREAIKCAYLPFSMGPRICTGAGFATQEAILLLAGLVRRYQFSPAPGHVPKPVGRLTIRSENGIRLILNKR